MNRITGGTRGHDSGYRPKREEKFRFIIRLHLYMVKYGQLFFSDLE